MRIKHFFIVPIVGFLVLSCNNKKGDFIVTGTVINAGSKQPIDSVMVILFGGNPSSTGIGAVDDLNDNPPNGNNDTTIYR